MLGEEFLVTRMIFTMILAWILLEMEDIEEHLEVWPTKWQGWNLDPAIYPLSVIMLHTVFHHPYIYMYLLYCTTAVLAHHLSKSALYLPPFNPSQFII